MSSKADAVSAAKSSSTKVGSASSTGRPSLKNLTRARVPRAGIIAVTIATTAALSWKFFVSDRHKRNIASFYKLVLPCFFFLSLFDLFLKRKSNRRKIYLCHVNKR
jgi:hypothetical protein